MPRHGDNYWLEQIAGSVATGGSDTNVNISKINAITPLMGNGVTGTGSQRVTIASDNTPFAVKTDQTTHGTTDLVAADLTKIVGNTTSVGNGVSGTGVQRVSIASDSTGNIATIGTSVVPGTSATHLGKSEDAAAVSGDTGVFALGVRNDALSSVTNTDGDYSQITVDKTGRAVVLLFAPEAARSRGTATVTSTSDTSLVAASGDASLKTYITDIQIANTGVSTSLITFKDGSGGSTLGYSIAPAGGGSNIHFNTPLVTTANTAFYFAAATASTTIYLSAQGYKAP